jgi:hypothetical protein
VSQQTEHCVPSPFENSDSRGVFTTVKITDVTSDGHTDTEPLRSRLGECQRRRGLVDVRMHVSKGIAIANIVL